MQVLANILGCKVEYLPTVYLGMSLGNKHKAQETWDGIVEKIEERLAKWKTQYLSLGGQTHFDQCCLRLTTNLCNVLIPFNNQGDEQRAGWAGHQKFEATKYQSPDDVVVGEV